MNRLLIVDDDAHLRKLVLTYAELDGFQCSEAENGRDAIEKISSMQFSIIVLDVMMPGMDGFETLTEIRKASQVPVIMLTARTEEFDKLLGFNIGADDYVSKPFSPKELMARVGAVLKRTGRKQADELVFGKLAIFPGARSVTLGDETLNLPPKEFDLLLKLVQNERLVLSRERLLETVWSCEYSGDTRTVDSHIGSLREHLGEYRKTIQTVWGVGYKFEYKNET